MKFSVECSEFKKAVDKAIVVMAKSSTLPILHCLHIETKENSISIYTTNTEQYLKLELPATIIEPGECFVDKDDVKRVYGLSGFVTIEMCDGKFVVQNSKKKSAIPIYKYNAEDILPCPVMEDEQLFANVSEKYFVETLAALSNFVSSDDSNKMMTGYNLDGGLSRITTLDGHRFTFKRMQECFHTEHNVTIPSAVYNHLKKIINAKDDSNMQLFVDKKYLLFIGNDYQLWSRLFEGEYFKIDRMIPGSFDFSFSVNPEEMEKIGKEYYSVVKNSRNPMLLSYSKDGDVMRTGLITSNYETVDKIENFDERESSGLTKDFTYAFNPLYIKEAMHLYAGTVVCKGTYQIGKFGSMYSPIFLDDGEYFSCVLPVNVDDGTINQFNKFIDAA